MVNLPPVRSGPAAPLSAAPWTSSVGAAIVCSVLIGQRFAVTIGGGQIFLCQFIVAGGLIALAVVGSLHIHRTRLCLFSLFALAALCSYLANLDCSLLSFLNVLVIYGSFVFCTNADDRLYYHTIDWVHGCMLVIAMLALIQLVMQLGGLPYFDLSFYVDPAWTVANYHLFYPISDGHWLNKSNGVFLLEPSFLSQFSAVALLLEFFGRRRARRLLLYGAALVVAFAGTGLLLIAFVAVPVFLNLTRSQKIGVLVVAGTLLTWYFNTEWGQSVIERVAEFKSKGSSAFMRFVEPLDVLSSIFNQEYEPILFGHGPGSSVLELSTVLKLVYEYGILGTVPYLIYILYCFYADSRSKTIATALLFMHFVLSGSFLTPHTLYFFYIVLMLVPRSIDRRNAFRAPIQIAKDITPGYI
jgi:hypothetical protein